MRLLRVCEGISCAFGPAKSRLIGVSLELGGKNPMVVLSDADLDAAARGAVRGSFANAGQLCISCERLYLQASIAEPFLERFTAATRSLRLGPALDFSVDIGSLTSREQLEKVEAHLVRSARFSSYSRVRFRRA